MKSLAAALYQIWRSSIGRKLIVAVTGVILVAFLVGHVLGNLLVFQGREAMNDYAQFLHHFLHGWGVWIVRVGLIVVFVLHLVATISLTIENRTARADRYESSGTVQASRSSRIMIWSGLVVLAFAIFHILHYTVRIDPDLADLPDIEYAVANPGEHRHDVYAMVIRGFQSIPVSLFYIIAITLLCSHLSHGIASLFQTLGIGGGSSRKLIQQIGLVVAIVIWLGFISIPIAVLRGKLADEPAEPDEVTQVVPRD